MVRSPPRFAAVSVLSHRSTRRTARVGTLAGALRFYRAAFPEGVPDEARALGWRGFFAWSWRQDWPQAFDRLQFGGKPLVPPILQALSLSRPSSLRQMICPTVADSIAPHCLLSSGSSAQP